MSDICITSAIAWRRMPYLLVPYLPYLLVDRAGGARHSPGMAQKLRLQYPGAMNHRMNRGDRLTKATRKLWTTNKKLTN
jgi:hypothetical protein